MAYALGICVRYLALVWVGAGVDSAAPTRAVFHRISFSGTFSLAVPPHPNKTAKLFGLGFGVVLLSTGGVSCGAGCVV